jgi:hypothetical protein
MKTMWAALLLVCIIIVQGCGGSSEDLAIRGKIVAVGDSEDGKGRTALVEGAKDKDTKYDKASVTIPADAKLYILKDGKKQATDVASLKSGQVVEISFAGEVMATSPVQGTAKQVVITGESS